MNEFRKRLLGGAQPENSLLRGKQPKAKARQTGEDESFADLAIARTSGRSANHRGGDRHRLASEQALLLRRGTSRPVTLINLSGGGAMIEGASDLMLWDRVELQLGSISRLEAVVRWLKDDRAGLEFAHETRIEADDDAIAETLREVLARSFPDIALEAAARRAVAEVDAVALASVLDDPEPKEMDERELRHPLIWTGLVHFNHDSVPVRLRNISTGGTLVESAGAFPLDAELLLDLGEAGTIFSTVHWAHGDQAGLKFHTPFDLSALAKARPEVAGVRWVAPDYLREDRSSNSPWSDRWGRADLDKLHRALEITRSAIRRR